MADPLTTLPYTVPNPGGLSPNQLIQQQYGVGGTPYSLQPTDPWAQLMQSLAPIVGGIGNLATARLGMNTANQAAGMADPFSGERQAYQGQLRQYMGANSVDPSQVTAGTNSALASLMSLLQNPASISSTPEYKAGLGFGTEAVNRGMGASGMLNSGNRALGLEKFGQDYGMGFLHQILGDRAMGVNENIAAANLGLGAQGQGFNQLGQLSGVNIGQPGVAAGLVNQGRQNEISGLGQAAGGLLGGAGGFISSMQRILNSGGGGYGSPSFTSGGIPDANIPNFPGTGQFNPDDLSGWMGLDSTLSLGTNSDIFSGLMDAFG